MDKKRKNDSLKIISGISVGVLLPLLMLFYVSDMISFQTFAMIYVAFVILISLIGMKLRRRLKP